MADNPELLAAVLASPDDDAVRLVCADWFEENGRPARAEFIRLQIARDPTTADRERHLLFENETEWTAPLHGLVRRARFVRGFVERVTLRPSAFVERGGELFRLAPVRHVVFAEEEVDARRLAACPHLANAETLDFRDGSELGADHLGRLLGSGHLTRLRALVLRFNPVEAAGLRVIAASPVAGRLHTLDVYDAGIDASALVGLSDGPPLAELRTLVLSGNDLSDEYVTTVGAWKPFPQLGRLFAAHTGGAEDLALSVALDLSLRTLDLSFDSLTTEDVQLLSESERLAGLEALWVRGNELTRAGRRRLLERFGDRVHF